MILYIIPIILCGAIIHNALRGGSKNILLSLNALLFMLSIGLGNFGLLIFSFIAIPFILMLP